jgi:hypothetical protein
MGRDFLTMDMRTKRNGKVYIKVALDILRSSKYLSNEEEKTLKELEMIYKSEVRVEKINSIFRNT